MVWRPTGSCDRKFRTRLSTKLNANATPYEVPPVARTPAVWVSDLGLTRVQGFKRGGAVHSDAGVASLRVVPALYPLEHGVGKFVACLPGFPVEQLELHRSPEGLHH